MVSKSTDQQPQGQAVNQDQQQEPQNENQQPPVDGNQQGSIDQTANQQIETNGTGAASVEEVKPVEEVPQPDPALAPGVAPALAPGVAPEAGRGLTSSVVHVDEAAQAVAENKPEAAVTEGRPSVENKAVSATPHVNQTMPTRNKQVSKPHSPGNADVKDLKPIPASKLTKTLEKLKAEGTPNEKSLIASFEEYITKLAYRRMVTDNEGVQLQRSLFLALRHVLNLQSNTEFNRLWSIALAIWNENRDQNQPFYVSRRSRFLAAWGWSEDDLQAMLNIHNLMDLTCDPVTRAEGLKRVSLETALRTGFTEAERQRLNNYYQG